MSYSQIIDGKLHEGLISTGSKQEKEPDPLDPDIIGRLENLYTYKPVSTDYYLYEEGDEMHFARILKWYEQYFSGTNDGASILFPVGALRALRRLSKFSSGRAIVISGDKGNNNPDQFSGILDPHIAIHGSFSLMVNYHAIGAWFTSKGGFSLHNPQEEASLKVSCFVLTGNDSGAPTKQAVYVPDGFLNTEICETDKIRSTKFPNLVINFREYLDGFGPNDFFVMQKTLKEDSPNPPLRSVVSLLKLGDWDPDVFFKFRDLILNNAPNCGQKLRSDLCRGMERVWTNYYPMDTDKDIAFEIGRFYYGIREYKLALKYYAESSSTIGEHHVTFHNQGLCNYSMNNLAEALEQFKKATNLNPAYEKAKNWVIKVAKEIEESIKTNSS